MLLETTCMPREQLNFATRKEFKMAFRDAIAGLKLGPKEKWQAAASAVLLFLQKSPDQRMDMIRRVRSCATDEQYQSLVEEFLNKTPVLPESLKNKPFKATGSVPNRRGQSANAQGEKPAQDSKRG